MRRFTTILVAVVGVLVIVVVAFLVWANILFQGEREPSLAAWRSNAVEISGADDGSWVLEPTSGATDVGLVFVPGAKVHPSAYLFKLSGIVEATGMTVVITHPTLNLAFFDTRPLSTFTDHVEGVDRWFVGGHSLGGVRACQLAGQGLTDAAADPHVAGVVLFGSYCANDLSDADLAVLSFVGTEDGLSTPETVAEAAPQLPDDTVTVLLEGANHASFGDYGPQPGDGVATIGSDEVRELIAAATAEFVARSAP